jgi:hypothetical protein
VEPVVLETSAPMLTGTAILLNASIVHGAITTHLL